MRLLFFISLVISQNLLSQKTEINNTISEKHQFANGTKLAIVPPQDFVKAEAFAGFQHAETNSSIMVSEIPAPYATIVAGFTAENLAKRNMTFKAKKEIIFQNKPATIFEVSQNAYGNEYLKKMLVFGDDKLVVLINFIYPANDSEIENKIVNSLNTAFYEIEKKIDPLADASISVDIAGTKFQFAIAMAGSYLFTPDGNVPVKSGDNALFTMGQSISNFEIDDKKTYSQDRLRLQPNGGKVNVETIAEIEIDGLKGFEITGFGVDAKGEKELNYQVMLYTEKKYYILVGLASTNFDFYLSEFKAIAKTFKRKL